MSEIKRAPEVVKTNIRQQFTREQRRSASFEDAYWEGFLNGGTYVANRDRPRAYLAGLKRGYRAATR